ncbi:MAG TPA: hypothetical protein VNM47_06275 [Terriglobia bacterium]|nr:hypothetical protein [Terriglobia bacterium]
MRGIENVLALGAGALMLSATLIWAQQSAGSQPPPAAGQESSPAKAAKTEKPKEWKGKLVDANCVVKALNTVSVQDDLGAGQGFPHFANGPSQPQPYPGGGAQQAQQPATVTCPGLGCMTPDAKTGPYPMRGGLGGPMGSTTTDGPGGRSDIKARMRRAALVEDAVKKCAATNATSEFGLALSSGRLIGFDQEGNGKASQAIKVAELKPGKPAKATVEGIEESNGLVHVTSVEIKGKH